MKTGPLVYLDPRYSFTNIYGRVRINATTNASHPSAVPPPISHIVREMTGIMYV
jgi:hypothetical protein